MRPARPLGGAPATWTTGSAIAATARPTAIASALATAPIAVTRIVRIPLRALRPRGQIDQVEELAALLRAGRCSFGLDHAHQANLVRTPANDIQCFHESAKPVALELESGSHGFRLGTTTQVDRLGRRGRSVAFSRACIRGFGFDGRGFNLFDGLVRTFLRCHSLGRWRVGTRRLGTGTRFLLHGGCGHRFRWRGLGNWRVFCPIGALGLGRPLQQNSGKLGDGLHGVRPSLRVNQGRFISRLQRLS